MNNKIKYSCSHFTSKMLSRVLTFLTVILAVQALGIEDIIKLIIKTHPELLQCIPSPKMFDASAKIPSGIRAGNLVDLGNFDLCLSHKNKTEPEGKYCLVKMIMPLDGMSMTVKTLTRYQQPQPQERVIVQGMDPTDNSTGLILGWCLPLACPLDQFTSVISNYTKLFKLDMQVKPLAGGMCQSKEDLINKYDTQKIIIIIFLSLTLLLMVISTIYDMYIKHYNQDPAHILLLAFSIRTNGEKLLSVSNNPAQLPCLNGIRFLSMMWVIYGHRFATTAMEAIANLTDVLEWTKEPINMYIINATVSVDTFFVLSGLLVAYVFCLTKDKGINFNIILFYIHRYLRLTPVLAVLVWIHAFFLDLLGSGPFWPFIIGMNKFCQDNWWAPLVYVQNYYNTREMCIGQTWYLSVDMQLFILSPILLIPLWKWPKKTMYVSTFLVLVSIVIPFAISYEANLPAFSFDATNNFDYMEKYYYTTHTRFGPWLMGVMLGYYLFKLKKDSIQIKLHPILVLIGWIVGIGLLLTILFSSHDLLLHPDKLGNSFFNALHRHGWSLGVCWVIFACTQGYGGPINTFLSWSVFQVLGRFTYTMYLVHLSVMYLIASSARVNSYFTSFNIVYIFWGDFMITLALSICLTLAYESPMVTIEKLLFKTDKKPKKTELPVHNHSNGQDNAGFTKD